MSDDARQQKLINDMRESGKAFLRANPNAFGGGIDPNTGVRRVGGRRVSVTSPTEEAAGAKRITLEQAQATENQARQERAKQELARINALRQQKIVQVRNRQLLDSQTKNKILITTTTLSNGSRIFETTNLNNGETTTRLFEKQNGHVQETSRIITKTQPKQSAKPETSKPQGTSWDVQPAPSLFDTLKSNVGQKGYITGTLDWVSGTLVAKHDALQQKAGYYAGLQETELFGGVLRTTPYFLPGGSAVLIGEGVESLISKKGKQDIADRYASLQQDGFNKFFAGGTSILPNVAMIGIGVATSKFGSNMFSKIRTIGRSEVPISELTNSEVLAGKKSFPTADPKTHLQMFKEQGYGFHATSNPWSELKTGAGSSELSGTYISTQVSPHFLRAGGESNPRNILDYLFGDVIYGTSKPGVMQIVPGGFRQAPYRKIPNTANKPHGFKFIEKESYGWAEVPSMKSEIEAVIRPDTQLEKTSSKKFFKYKGRNIPIDEFKVTGEIAPGASAEKTYIMQDVRASYGGYGYSRASSGSKVGGYSIPRVMSSLFPNKYSSPSSSYRKSKSSSAASFFNSINYGKSSPSAQGNTYNLRSFYSSQPSLSRPLNIFRGTMKNNSFFEGRPWASSVLGLRKSGLFSVEVRRFGKFYRIGNTRNINSAYLMGIDKVGKTLAASFRIKGLMGLSNFKTPKGFRLKNTPFGKVYIEKNKFRLSKPGEKIAIRKARKKKKRRN